MITATQLRAIMPGAGRRADLFALPLAAAMDRFDISTPTRAAAFIAQVAHESGQLVYVREIWGPTPTQSRYEGRVDLGNTVLGDGKRFLGRGLIQVTGRKNYLLCGFGLHLDLIAHPELLEQPEHAAASAGWYWETHGLNRFADAGDFVGLTRAINGGTNGLQDRQLFWARAKSILGVKA
ncbi:glycoside hydrolase family 19 protein [Cupriavidus basilensis]